MAIIGALPVTLTNGTTADATQVMSDFNSIVSQVNANGAALAGGNAFTGTQTIGGDTVVTTAAVQTISGKTMQGPNGSAASPTYTFSAHSTSGMSCDSSGNLILSTFGNEVVFMDGSANTCFGGSSTSAWGGSQRKVVEICPSGPGSGQCFIGINPATPNFGIFGTNYYTNGSSVDVYKSNGNALGYVQQSNGHVWITAPIGTAGAPATFTAFMNLDTAGRLSGSAFHNNSAGAAGTTNQYIASGTYTPTLTPVGNVASATSIGFQWMRVGNVVTVTGSMTVTPSVAATCTVNVALPLASATTNLAGCVQGAGNVINGQGVFSNAGVARAAAASTNTSANVWYLTFTYEVA